MKGKDLIFDDKSNTFAQCSDSCVTKNLLAHTTTTTDVRDPANSARSRHRGREKHRSSCCRCSQGSRSSHKVGMIIWLMTLPMMTVVVVQGRPGTGVGAAELRWTCTEGRVSPGGVDGGEDNVGNDDVDANSTHGDHTRRASVFRRK